MITYRLGTIRNADKSLVIKDGGITEEGDHDLLMSKNEITAALLQCVRIQAVGIITELYLYKICKVVSRRWLNEACRCRRFTKAYGMVGSLDVG